MEIQEVPIDKIKPDTKQPRQSFEAVRIREMAKSILTEGVINPIEIDKKYVIITGEMRWRSAKEAGLKTVPCKVLEISDNDRFMRQVIENVHHNTMTPWDTAKSLEKLLLTSPGEVKREGERYNGATWLGDKIGKSVPYISEYLDVLEASESFQNAVKKGMKHTMIRAIKNTPEKHKKEMEEKITSGEVKSRDGAMAISQAVKQNPEKAKDILKQNFSECKTTDEIKDKIKKVDPNFTLTPITDNFVESCDFPEALGKITMQLMRLLRDNPAETVAKFHLDNVIQDLVLTKRSIDRWKGGQEIILPAIEVECEVK